MKEKTKRKVWIALAALTLMLTIIGATYAYFIVSEGTTVTAEVGATTSQVDSLTFSVDKDIYVHTRQEDFKEGSGNVSDDATATATLMAGSGEEPRYTYNTFIIIYENTFIYTTEDHKTELLLKVNGPDGEITAIDGLTYNTELKGFDITTKKGLIPISLDREITTTDKKIESWNVEVVLVNLDSDQTPNASKKFDAELKIQPEGPAYHETCEDNTLSCVIAKKSIDSANNLYYHDGKGDYINANLEAKDKSYRYAGASLNVNNYVCLGSSEATCPTANLYRIIGVFPTDETASEYQVKLIKNTSIGNNYWSGSSSNKSNDWSNSTLRTDTLNNTSGTYWTSLGVDANKVADHNWVISGGKWSNIGIQNAQIVYNYEVAKECSSCTNKETYATLANKVGLMYVSDYRYASSTNLWNLSGNSSTLNKTNNWLQISNSGNTSDHEWTISRYSDTMNSAFRVIDAGNVGNSNVYNYSYAVRPCIYLDSFVEFLSGTGTSTDPYRIK